MTQLAWHQLPGSPKFDYSQPGELGVVRRFGAEIHLGKQQAEANGYGLGQELGVSVNGQNFVVTVSRLVVSTETGMDEVYIEAGTRGYSFIHINVDRRHKAGDQEWRVRFGIKMVPGNQLNSSGTDAGPIPTEAELMPMPTTILEWKKWIGHPDPYEYLDLPKTLAGALNMAATYTTDDGDFESSPPKVSRTLKGSSRYYLCVSVDVDRADEPGLLVRTAEYEWRKSKWPQILQYPEGVEA